MNNQPTDVKKHWRYGGQINHIGVEALPNGNDIVVEIEKIEWKDKAKINGQNKPAWICTFKKNNYFNLPMVLNTTNRKRICRIADNNYPETIKNLRVTLTREMSNIPGEGIRDWALRIHPDAPKEDSYEDAINAYISQMVDCATLRELQSVWSMIQQTKYKADVKLVTTKDELKETLQ